MSALLGETAAVQEADDLKAICEKLEVINLQLARRKAAMRRMLHWLFLLACAAVAVMLALLLALGSPYLGWDFGNPETAVAGTLFHAFEWLFVRLAPLLLIGAGFGAFLTRKEM